MVMKITLNGKSTEIGDNETLGGLIGRLKIDGPVAAQVNEKIIRKDHLAQAILHPDDVVEIFGMMGGG